MHHLATGLGQGNKAVGADVVGDAEAFPRGDVHIVAIQLVGRGVTDRVDNNVDVVPVLAQFGEHSFYFVIAGNIARENQRTAPAFGEFLYSGFELFILVSECQLGALFGKGFGDAISDRSSDPMA